MLVMLMLLGIEKSVAIGTARLIFILPEKREDVKLNKEIVDSINYDSLFVDEDSRDENLEGYLLRVYSNEGFIELKVEENNKEEIWKIIKDMEKEDRDKQFSGK